MRGVGEVVAATGGAPRRLTTLDVQRGEVGHRWPIVVPGGSVLFTSFTARGLQDARIEAVSLDTGERRTIVEQATFPICAQPGIFSFAETMRCWAWRSMRNSFAVSGSAASFIENIGVRSLGAPFAALAASGTLAYVAGIGIGRPACLGLPRGRGTAAQRAGPRVREPTGGTRRTPFCRRSGQWRSVAARSDATVFYASHVGTNREQSVPGVDIKRKPHRIQNGAKASLDRIRHQRIAS